MDEDAIRSAVEELRSLVRSDGADLVLEEADARRARIGLRVDLSAVSCADCILPPDFLRQMIRASLERSLRGEFELVLRDPREAPAGPAGARSGS